MTDIGWNAATTCADCGVEMEYNGDGIDRSLDSWSPIE